MNLFRESDHPVLPYSYCNRHGVLPVEDSDSGAVTLYYADLPQFPVLNEISRYLGKMPQLVQLKPEAFRDSLVTLYQSNGPDNLSSISTQASNAGLVSLEDVISDVTDVLEQDDDAPIINLISKIISEAIRQQASDIHISPGEQSVTVHFRVDGTLRQIASIGRELAPLVISRTKVMAKLDIAEKRVPQDGRISIKVGSREVDLRISTMPASFGERIVLRILDKKMGYLQLEQLGLSTDNLQALRLALSKPHGIILATGPTGSGKSTMLYAGLSHINNGSRNILTIEDPIEYQLSGIGQTQVNIKAGMTFARGLRSMLRQDPDVIMVGEIRDEETIRVAIQASLTGHLVLSTLHTNTAVGAITRLEDMGIEPFLISSTLSAVIAQRLVRVLCDTCKQPYAPNENETEIISRYSKSAPPKVLYRSSHNGCTECQQQGYRGRTAICEIILIDDEMKALIHDKKSEAELIGAANKKSNSLMHDGMTKVLEGKTSIEELERVLGSLSSMAW